MFFFKSKLISQQKWKPQKLMANKKADVDLLVLYRFPGRKKKSMGKTQRILSHTYISHPIVDWLPHTHIKPHTIHAWYIYLDDWLVFNGKDMIFTWINIPVPWMRHGNWIVVFVSQKIGGIGDDKTAKWVIICYRSHLVSEPGNSIEIIHEVFGYLEDHPS